MRTLGELPQVWSLEAWVTEEDRSGGPTHEGPRNAALGGSWAGPSGSLQLGVIKMALERKKLGDGAGSRRRKPLPALA